MRSVSGLSLVKADLPTLQLQVEGGSVVQARRDA